MSHRKILIGLLVFLVITYAYLEYTKKKEKYADVYYNKGSGPSKTVALRDFHNLYVKQLLIETVSTPGSTLIDFAVGKGGDLQKWIKSKLKFVLGIDISKDNIHNKKDGACARYISMKQNKRDINRKIWR